MLLRPRLRPIGANKARIIIRAAASTTSHVPPPPPPPQPHGDDDASSTAPPTIPKVIFSGIQPTGPPHLGNYLGALRNWVHLQAAAAPGDKLLFSVVDLHAITTPVTTPVVVNNPQQQGSVSNKDATDDNTNVDEKLRKRRRQTLAALLAIGLDPEKSTLFYQSSCPAHAELMWILSCTASMGYLSRMTQWKSKLSLSDDTEALDEEAKTKLKLGLFSYPVLQAADILVHGATHVPVGDDQKQHLEFTRDCAKSFNHAYGAPVLVPPETILSPARRIMSLRTPTAKMSKSDPQYRSTIGITDHPEEICKKVRAARTDHDVKRIIYDPAARPGVANLLHIIALLEKTTPDEIAASINSKNGKKAVMLKDWVARVVNDELEFVRERYLDYMWGQDKGPKWLDDIAEKGAQKANANAQVTMKRVKEAVGLS